MRDGRSTRRARHGVLAVLATGAIAIAGIATLSDKALAQSADPSRLQPGTVTIEPRAIEVPSFDLNPPANDSIGEAGRSLAACTVRLHLANGWLGLGCRIILHESRSPTYAHNEQRLQTRPGARTYTFQMRSRPCERPVELWAVRSCSLDPTNPSVAVVSLPASGGPTTRRDFTLP